MIIKVKRAKIYFLENDFNLIVENLQKSSSFMLDNKYITDSFSTQLDQKVKDIDLAIKAISKYTKKEKAFSFHEATYSDYLVDYSDLDEVILNINSNNREILDNLNTLNSLSEEKKNLLMYQSINVPTSYFLDTKYVDIIVGKINEKELPNLIEIISLFKDAGFEILFEEKDIKGLAIYIDKSKKLELSNKLETISFHNVVLPNYDIKITDRISLIDEETLKISQSNNELILSFTEFKEKLDKLYCYHDQVLNQKYISSLKYDYLEKCAFLEGFIRVDKVLEFESSFKDINTCSIEYKDIEKTESAPTVIKNNKFVANFEGITNMFSVPSRHEIDPNPMMSFWYLIIIGIMIGDIGYGLVISIFTILYIKLKHPKGGFLKMLYVFFYSGIMAIIGGFIFNSIFGYPFLEAFGLHGLLSPLDDIILLLVISVGIGIVHIICGLSFKAFLSFRDGNWQDALSKGISWIFILIGVVLISPPIILPMLGDTTTKVDLSTFAFPLFILGIAFILLFSGSGKNIGGKVAYGLAGVYNVTGYLSDVLSYSRILALCVSGAAIASTMNLLAGMVSGVPVIGFLLYIVVFLIGHGINFASGLLGAYVHDSRLQYLEFFGKFYDGGGTLFMPLEIKLKYLDNIKI
ncbi:MAG: hypothetical protein LBV58_03795 [Acholeplasmatales bacterium]|nr:hypothetical protein [Acholeplasmatales bacterium]